MQFKLSFKTVLCFGTCFSQNRRVRIPTLNAFVITSPMFIINDEWNDVMTKAFFYHNESADTAIIIFKGMDLLKAYVEIQDSIKVHEFLFICLNQFIQLVANLRCGYSKFARACPILTNTNLMFLISIGSIC